MTTGGNCTRGDTGLPSLRYLIEPVERARRYRLIRVVHEILRGEDLRKRRAGIDIFRVSHPIRRPHQRDVCRQERIADRIGGRGVPGSAGERGAAVSAKTRVRWSVPCPHLTVSKTGRPDIETSYCEPSLVCPFGASVERLESCCALPGAEQAIVSRPVGPYLDAGGPLRDQSPRSTV